jgi:hypothetical protein
MTSKKKIGFGTKFLSNRNYLNEVPVEKKTTNRFNFLIGRYDQYASQIIRAGNCITLLSDPIEITEDTFWKTTHFEFITKYVFFTFNKSFLIRLKEKTESLKLSILKQCAALLHENFIPYDCASSENTDEELQWCLIKNSNLKNQKQFNKIYELDSQNRRHILDTIEKRILQFPPQIPQPEDSKQINESEKEHTTNEILFLETLRPMNGSTERTLEFIKNKIIDAGFEFNIFSPVPKLENGKNQYGLNGSIAAMIEFFFQHDYFKREYALHELFRSFLGYSGNSIAKLNHFITGFRDNRSFIRQYEKLKKLKISKLP